MDEIIAREHDSYVFQLGRRYSWNCPCGARAEKPYDRRMDADEAASDHDERASVAAFPPDRRPHYELNDGTCVGCGEPWMCQTAQLDPVPRGGA